MYNKILDSLANVIKNLIWEVSEDNDENEVCSLSLSNAIKLVRKEKDDFGGRSLVGGGVGGGSSNVVNDGSAYVTASGVITDTDIMEENGGNRTMKTHNKKESSGNGGGVTDVEISCAGGKSVMFGARGSSDLGKLDRVGDSKSCKGCSKAVDKAVGERGVTSVTQKESKSQAKAEKDHGLLPSNGADVSVYGSSANTDNTGIAHESSTTKKIPPIAHSAKDGAQSGAVKRRRRRNKASSDLAEQRVRDIDGLLEAIFTEEEKSSCPSPSDNSSACNSTKGEKQSVHRKKGTTVCSLFDQSTDLSSINEVSIAHDSKTGAIPSSLSRENKDIGSRNKQGVITERETGSICPSLTELSINGGAIGDQNKVSNDELIGPPPSLSAKSGTFSAHTSLSDENLVQIITTNAQSSSSSAKVTQFLTGEMKNEINLNDHTSEVSENSKAISVFDEEILPCENTASPRKLSLFDRIFKRKAHPRCEYIDISTIKCTFTGEFDNVQLARLANSIKKRGMLLPITVYEHSKGEYRIIDGKKRYLAARLLSFNCICVQILPVNRDMANVLSRDSINSAFTKGKSSENTDIIDLYKEIHLIDDKELSEAEKRCNFSKKELELLERTDNAPITDRLSDIESSSFREYAISSYVEMYADFESSILSLIENTDKRYTQNEKLILKDLRLVFNSIDKTIKRMKKSGINVKSERIEDSDGYIMTIAVKKP